MRSSKPDAATSRKAVAEDEASLAELQLAGSAAASAPRRAWLFEQPVLARRKEALPSCAEFTLDDQTGRVVRLAGDDVAEAPGEPDGEIARFELGGERYALVIALSVRLRRVLQDEIAATVRTDFPKQLSERERQIVEQLCVGATTAQAAERLGMRELTVRSHLKTIFCKLGVRSRGAMVCRYALALARSQANGRPKVM